jgi:hypothetical protein
MTLFSKKELFFKCYAKAAVLLYCVEYAPHEVERLMSLLAEARTLTIFEGIQPMFLSNPGSKANKDQLPNINHSANTLGEMQNKAHVEIAPRFQLVVTCNDPQKLTSALRSRFFCLNIECAKGKENLMVLAECILFQKV